MNIVVMGAGAIGSLFGGLLSEHNDVVLVGRKPHVEAINKKGLSIDGKTKLSVKISAVESVNKISFIPDFLILSVKSFGTETAMKEAKKIMGESTVVISIQNGLDNVEKISKYLPRNRIFVCITTHGVVFSKPGSIIHTGVGKTTIGVLSGKKTMELTAIIEEFNTSGIKTNYSKDIVRDIWIKAIVNSSINPLTTIFQCSNNYLLKNPILEKIVEKICEESTNIANSENLNLSYNEMIKKTKEVINETSENKSSMLQSFLQGKKTEINSINGMLLKIARKNNVESMLNEVLVNVVSNQQ